MSFKTIYQQYPQKSKSDTEKFKFEMFNNPLLRITYVDEPSHVSFGKECFLDLYAN